MSILTLNCIWLITPAPFTSEEKYMYTSLLLESGISIAQTVEHGAVELYALNATYVALDKIICINVNVFITFNC